ncbi:MAG: DoxX family protein [Gemmatimonadaceae bacterium]
MAIAYGDSLLLNLGLLLIRVIFGLLMAAHGSQKLFGWLGGYGLAGTGGFFETLGFRPGKQFATVASLSEFIGGLLFAFGFLGPIGPALILAVMLVASISVHWKNGLFASTNGVEVPVLYATAVVGITLIGFGSYSLDGALGLTTFWTPGLIALALIVGVVGGLANLMLRRRPPTTPAV